MIFLLVLSVFVSNVGENGGKGGDQILEFSLIVLDFSGVVGLLWFWARLPPSVLRPKCSE